MTNISADPFATISDIFVPPQNIQEGFVYPGPRPLDPGLHTSVMDMIEQAKRSRSRATTVHMSNCNWRFQLFPSGSGDYFIFRKASRDIPPLRSLGIPKPILDLLTGDRLLKGGLIIISGNPGNGKSTTMGSLVVERLIKWGGICITVEDPIELPLQGAHGSGFCLQRAVTTDEDFNQAIKDALRAYPSKTPAMMMIGEIRDAEAASLALRSSVDGRLVVISMHAGNAVMAIQRLISMASATLGTREARELLASSFRMSINQELRGHPAELKIPTLLLDTQSVVGTIRVEENSLEQLQNDLQMQRLAFRNGQPLELRPIT